MTISIDETTCSEFACALASKESVPGGGGAAAFAGALGIALGSMVANFTTGKKTYAQYEEDIQRILADGERIRLRLLELANEDAENFLPLSQAYGIPKEDPSRCAVIEKCTKAALSAPFEMMQEICKAIVVLEELSVKGSRMLISDVGCGAALSRAALESAALNACINTASLADRDFADAIDAQCDEMLLTYIPRAQAIVDSIMKKLRS